MPLCRSIPRDCERMWSASAGMPGKDGSVRRHQWPQLHHLRQCRGRCSDDGMDEARKGRRRARVVLPHIAPTTDSATTARAIVTRAAYNPIPGYPTQRHRPPSPCSPTLDVCPRHPRKTGVRPSLALRSASADQYVRQIPQQVPTSPERFVAIIPDAQTVNHLTVFLDGTSESTGSLAQEDADIVCIAPFPEGYACTIHFDQGKGWQLIGA
jgi:hypothetical protein